MKTWFAAVALRYRVVSRHGFRSVAALILTGVLCTSAGLAQPSPESTTATLSGEDSATALAVAVTHNNLERDGVTPWHIRAKYELSDLKGNSVGAGTYEEWWVSQGKNKHTFTTTGFSRTDYFTDKGVFRIDSGKFTRMIGPQQNKTLVRPLSEETLDDFTAETREEQPSNLRLKCITLTLRKGAPVVPITHMYCFDPSSLILRTAISEYGLYQTLYNDVIRFGDQYVAKDVQTLHNRTPAVAIHVEQIEALGDISDAVFSPPPDAEKLPPTLTAFAGPTGLPEEHLIRRVQPQLPETAKATHTSGEVAIKFTVDKDGHVTNEEVVSGPSIFRQAALNAIKLWE